MTKTPFDLVPSRCFADLSLRDYHPRTRCIQILLCHLAWAKNFCVHHKGSVPVSGAEPQCVCKTLLPTDAATGCQHLACVSDRDLRTALTAAAAQDCATRAGPHTQAETVGLVSTTVVRLVRTLRHDYSYKWQPP